MILNKKLLVIVGPTATGKTSLALYLAKRLNGELVSADSRQVYRKMDIGTGKDLLKNSKLQIPNYKWNKQRVGFYIMNGVRVWGYDLVDPTENFSVAQYVDIVYEVIKDIIKRGKLPILVGGTGLYIKAVVDGIDTVAISPNLVLRKNLEEKSSGELFEILAEMDPVKAASLNVSDRKNPRRLVRAIEIADRVLKNNLHPSSKNFKTFDARFIGLTASRDFIYDRINERVQERINTGFENEIKKLLEFGVTWRSQSMQSLGYKQFRDYVSANSARQEAIEKWSKEEKKYSKRQITWFKKDKRIHWFDISRSGWKASVEKDINKWHNS